MPTPQMIFVKSTGKAWGDGFRWYRIDPMVPAGSKGDSNGNA